MAIEKGTAAEWRDELREFGPAVQKVWAVDVVNQAANEMQDRGVTYDAPEGERSMAKTVAMFNTLKGTNISETDGWEFMQILKMVRANQGAFKLDNYVDGAAYAALAAESESQR